MQSEKRVCLLKDGVGLDRLSKMPDEVIVNILSFMPTRDAVKTVLLRHFGNLWTSVRVLRFNISEYYVRQDTSGGDDNSDKELPIIDAAISRFVRFVRNVLMLHRRSPIDLFHLDFKFRGINLDECIMNEARVWLQFATDREVKHLLFACNYLDDLAPPCCVVRSQSLDTLTLSGCLLEEYERQPKLHMGSLRILKLTGVHGSDEAFNQLISACPSLQELHINWSYGLQNLNITAPSVRRLNLELLDFQPFTLNCPGVKRLDISVHGTSPSFLLDVIDVSSLEIVTVGRLPEGLSRIKAFCKQFRDVKVLTLSSQGFEQLCCVEEMDFPQNRWHALALRPQWDLDRCLEVITELVKSSVNLDRLVIYGVQSSGDLEVLRSEFSSCVIPLLTSVEISVCVKYYEVQLQVIEFILRNAVVLEELVITSEDNQLTVVEMFEFVKQLSTFKKASVNASVDLRPYIFNQEMFQ